MHAIPIASSMTTISASWRALLSNAPSFDRFLNDVTFRIVERLEAFCAARGRTLLQLAFGWLLAKPLVASVIAGASTPEQLQRNADAVGWDLGAEEIAEVDRITSRPAT